MKREVGLGLTHLLSDHSLVVFFFFQAEDGIRDVAVTGVQTCALPISKEFFRFETRGKEMDVIDKRVSDVCGGESRGKLRFPDALGKPSAGRKPAEEIGRASCRERV